MEEPIEIEFKNLSKRVDQLERQNNENENLLREIDKKVDIIFEKIVNADKTENLKLQNIDLKLQPINERVEKLEDSKKWLWRSIGGTALGLIATLIKILVEG